MRIPVKVVPSSSRSRIAGWIGDSLKVCVAAPPERGKANAAVIGILTRALGLPVDRVRIVAGAAATRKLIEVDDLDLPEIRRRLGS